MPFFRNAIQNALDSHRKTPASGYDAEDPSVEEEVG
jgi:hypothetical protein